MRLTVAILFAVLFVGALVVPMGAAPPADACGTSCLNGPIHQARADAIPPPLAVSAPRPVTYGAFSLARPPSFRFGVAVGQRDRLAAQEAAEASCRSSPRGCSRIVEFTDSCIAVTEGIRRLGLFITSDPRTYEVRGIDYGTASNPADAQRLAMRDCQSRERGALNCRIVQTACGAR